MSMEEQTKRDIERAEDEKLGVVRIGGPATRGRALFDRLFEKVTREWRELKPELERLGLHMKAVELREPRRAEMLEVLCEHDEVVFDGWTVRRCLDCREPVAGGPTRCMKCVGKLEGVERAAAELSHRLDSIEVTDKTVILLRGEHHPGEVEEIARVAGGPIGRPVVPVILLKPDDELSAGTRDEIVAELDGLIARNEYLAELWNKTDEELAELARRCRIESQRRAGIELSDLKLTTFSVVDEPVNKDAVIVSKDTIGSYILREGVPDPDGDVFSADELREIQERLGGDLVFVEGKLELHTEERIAFIQSAGQSAEGADNVEK